MRCPPNNRLPASTTIQETAGNLLLCRMICPCAFTCVHLNSGQRDGQISGQPTGPIHVADNIMRLEKLTERAIRQKTKRGYYNDGGGLYLRVAVGGSKSWVFRFKADGRPREMGLGPLATLGLKEAREKAREARQLRLEGIDPIDQRQAHRATARAQVRRVMMFRQCAEAYIAAHQDSWKNPKHRTQWPNSLAAYVYPVFGDMPVDEVDLDEQVWTIPASRMKAGKEHRVPLSKEALAILAEQQKVREGDFVFAGSKAGRPLGPNAMTSVLRRIGRTELTVHGFRSTFRDWAAEQTNFPREVCEMALAHTVSDKVEAAYRRGDLFAKRRQLMAAWARYCTLLGRAGEKVVALQR